MTPVTILGTRYDESEKRSLKMLLGGENNVVPVENSDGDFILAPI
jgi:DNA sulfur modification protein DndC